MTDIISHTGDPAYSAATSSLTTVEDEIATSKAAIVSYEAMVADAQEGKRREAKNLSRLQKRARVFRKAVFDLTCINNDHRED